MEVNKMGGKKKEPEVTQVPTMIPEQSQFLTSLLGMMGGYMGGESPFGQMPTLGERYGGGRPAPGVAPGAPGGKGGTAPGQLGSAMGIVAPGGASPPGQAMPTPGGPMSGMLEAMLAGPQQGPEVGQGLKQIKIASPVDGVDHSLSLGR